jgi:hypothetical protein
METYLSGIHSSFRDRIHDRVELLCCAEIAKLALLITGEPGFEAAIPFVVLEPGDSFCQFQEVALPN